MHDRSAWMRVERHRDTGLVQDGTPAWSQGPGALVRLRALGVLLKGGKGSRGSGGGVGVGIAGGAEWVVPGLWPDTPSLTIHGLLLSGSKSR